MSLATPSTRSAIAPSQSHRAYLSRGGCGSSSGFDAGDGGEGCGGGGGAGGGARCGGGGGGGAVTTPIANAQLSTAHRAASCVNAKSVSSRATSCCDLTSARLGDEELLNSCGTRSFSTSTRTRGFQSHCGQKSRSNASNRRGSSMSPSPYSWSTSNRI